MPDDAQPRRPAGPEPVSDAKKHANKLVVLSSVAKPPGDEAESLLGETAPGEKSASAPPAKPAEEGLIRAVGWTTRPGGTTTIIKLPPKTGVLPRLTSLSQKGHGQPPPLPVQGQLSGEEDEAKRLPPIKLQPSTLTGASESESIFSSGAPEVITSTPARGDEATQVLPHPASLIHHAPPLVPAEASAPLSEEETPRPSDRPVTAQSVSRTAELAEAMDSPPPIKKPESVSAANVVAPGEQVTQRLLPMSDVPGKVLPSVSPVGETKPPAETEVKKMRLPPRLAVSGRLKGTATEGAADKPSAVVNPPKVFPVAPPTMPLQPQASAIAAPVATVRAPIKATITPPTIPLRPATGLAPASTVPVIAAGAAGTAAAASTARLAEERKALLKDAGIGASAEREKTPPAPSTRAARMRKRRIVGIVAFYILFVALLPCLYFAALYFSQETRVEGQVIPPTGMVLANEAWIVTDFRDLAGGIASDLASDRMIVMEDMQEKLAHVQRAQADVAAREAKIRSLTDEAKADTAAQMTLVKDARESAQKIWDGPGAELEAEYQSKLGSLNQAIAERARANHLQYAPDPNYFSPEVWANAYRLALYQVPKGVNATQERLWLDQQMKNWHDFTKSMDQRQNELREQATQMKLSPGPKVADLKAQIDDLQSRIDGTIAEEEPIKAELAQARADLAAVQAKDAGLDAKPLEKLDALPEANITKRLTLASNGRFSWREVEKESKYDEDEKSHVYWLFARAYRSDGRQFWALHRFTVAKNHTVEITVEPGSFVSTKAILRPDLPPDEQTQ